MNRKIIAIYSLILGFGITGLWVVLIRSGSIQEGKSEMIFHLFSEFLMAVLCIVSGFKLMMDHKSATEVNLIAHAMVVYSVLNAAGYYSEKGESAMVIMFILLFLISVAIILVYIIPKRNQFQLY